MLSREALLTHIDLVESQNAALRGALRAIVADAKDEGRADMRDSVDEQLIEEARALLSEGKDK